MQRVRQRSRSSAAKPSCEERAVEGWDEFEGHTPHRPWIDEVKIACSHCGETVSRIKDVGNPWLDAGIVAVLDAATTGTTASTGKSGSRPT